MTFLKLFLRGIGSLPSLIEGVESLYGAEAGTRTGEQKREAAIAIVGAAINITDAIEAKDVIDSTQFTAGLGQIVDGVVVCLNASVWAKGRAF
jgi:hypothetical protein